MKRILFPSTDSSGFDVRCYKGDETLILTRSKIQRALDVIEHEANIKLAHTELANDMVVHYTQKGSYDVGISNPSSHISFKFTEGDLRSLLASTYVVKKVASTQKKVAKKAVKVAVKVASVKKVVTEKDAAKKKPIMDFSSFSELMKDVDPVVYELYTAVAKASAAVADMESRLPEVEKYKTALAKIAATKKALSDNLQKGGLYRDDGAGNIVRGAVTEIDESLSTGVPLIMDLSEYGEELSDMFVSVQAYTATTKPSRSVLEKNEVLIRHAMEKGLNPLVRDETYPDRLQVAVAKGGEIAKNAESLIKCHKAYQEFVDINSFKGNFTEKDLDRTKYFIEIIDGAFSNTGLKLLTKIQSGFNKALASVITFVSLTKRSSSYRKSNKIYAGVIDSVKIKVSDMLLSFAEWVADGITSVFGKQKNDLGEAVKFFSRITGK